VIVLAALFDQWRQGNLGRFRLGALRLRRS